MKKHVPQLIFCVAMAALLVWLFPDPAPQTVHAQAGVVSYPILVNDTGTAATIVKATSGTLHTLTVNTAGASAVITIFDLASAACTGTPSTNKKATITLPASGVLPGSLLYDGQFVNGICVQASVASDITISAY